MSRACAWGVTRVCGGVGWRRWQESCRHVCGGAGVQWLVHLCGGMGGGSGQSRRLGVWWSSGFQPAGAWLVAPAVVALEAEVAMWVAGSRVGVWLVAGLVTVLAALCTCVVAEVAGEAGVADVVKFVVWWCRRPG